MALVLPWCVQNFKTLAKTAGSGDGAPVEQSSIHKCTVYYCKDKAATLVHYRFNRLLDIWQIKSWVLEAGLTAVICRCHKPHNHWERSIQMKATLPLATQPVTVSNCSGDTCHRVIGLLPSVLPFRQLCRTQQLLGHIHSTCDIAGPDSKVYGAHMGPLWGRQDPGGPHVGPMNFAIWAIIGC